MSNLAMKYRASTWDDVVGNEKTVMELRKRVLSNNHNKVTLFLGLTGSGKTTLALLYGKSMMCTSLNEQGNPCNSCEYCKIIDNEYPSDNIYFYEGGSLGVAEVDKIGEQAGRKILGTNQKKLFFIDELQSIKSKEAQKKLLKILERERNNANFIMGAMEWDKLHPSLKDRGISFFITLDEREIRKALVKVIDKEGIEKFAELPDIIVTITDNCVMSMRRAMVLLERVILSELKTNEQVKKELKIMSSQELNETLTLILKGDPEVLREKLTEDSVKQISWKLVLMYKAECGLKLNRWEQSQLRGIKGGSIKKVQYMLDQINDLIKFPYLTPVILDTMVINCLQECKGVIK